MFFIDISNRVWVIIKFTLIVKDRIERTALNAATPRPTYLCHFFTSSLPSIFKLRLYLVVTNFMPIPIIGFSDRRVSVATDISSVKSSQYDNVALRAQLPGQGVTEIDFKNGSFH